MSTLTNDQINKIKDKIASIAVIPAGIGTKEAACSVSAINLALTGQLTDTIPDCMSNVVGRFIIIIQDAMPSEMRNSKEWRELLPCAAGTGRLHEKERMEVAIDWMWRVVLPKLLPIAEKGGFGKEWEVMLRKKNTSAATTASNAATYANAAANAYAAAYATYANANANAYAVAATAYANATAYAVAAAANAAANAYAVATYAAAYTTAHAATYAAYATYAATTAHTATAYAVANNTFWVEISPVDVLRRMIDVGEK